MLTQRILQLRSSHVLAYDEPLESRVNKDRKLSNYKLNDHSQALRRFNKYISHFSMLFKSAQSINKASLLYTEGKKQYLRCPTMITLTVPSQRVDDAKFKREILNRIILVFKRKFDVKVYIWKAEAQARGAIHFHFVVDRFCHHYAVRYYWYFILRDYDCINKDDQGHYIPVEKHSRICHAKKVSDLDSMEQILSSYFDLRHNEDGSLQHKHDRSKKVREIDGKFYGCSDNLRYNYLSFADSPKYDAELAKASRKDIQITHSTGISIFNFINTYYNESSKKWSSKTITNRFFTINNYYHFTFFSHIYLNEDITYDFHIMCKDMNMDFFRPDFIFL